jgi:hypothetical protein
MKALRFRALLIAFVVLAAAFLLASFAAPLARGQQNLVPELPVSQPSTQLELVIAGPQALLSPRKDWRPLFTAVLINHQKDPVVFVPPRNDWFGERRLEWRAVDSKGRRLDRQPNYPIECDVHGVMRAVPDLPALLLDTQAPKQIRNADLIVLQPGETYLLKNLADPWFSLNFRRHGVFTLRLHFALASEHYALPKNSPYAEALKNSSHIEVISNELTLTIN